MPEKTQQFAQNIARSLIGEEAAHPAQPLIQMQGIRKSYYIGQPNELEILHGIDLTVYPGEFVAIVGESGSGKSLSLIHIFHQHFKLVDVFSATENIALSMGSGEKFDLKKVHDKARAICEKYEFALDLDQKVYEMSVSQKQTLEIVKVLYRGADILILDEPTAVLTPVSYTHLDVYKRQMVLGTPIKRMSLPMCAP